MRIMGSAEVASGQVTMKIAKQEEGKWVTIGGRKVKIGPKDAKAPAPSREAWQEEAMQDIKRTGTGRHGNISVKIVLHPDRMATSPEEDKYAVETTVGGDRRYPTEKPMSMEEAQAFAVGQLSRPRRAQ